jgi:hypothetical protein
VAGLSRWSKVLDALNIVWGFQGTELGGYMNEDF